MPRKSESSQRGLRSTRITFDSNSRYDLGKGKVNQVVKLFE